MSAVVVIGGGQAGLAVSYELGRAESTTSSSSATGWARPGATGGTPSPS